MVEKFCTECGSALTMKSLDGEGMVPYCPACNAYRFPKYNAAVSMITRDKKDGKILLIKQYGRPDYILVAGYINRGESMEKAVLRELMEETGLVADMNEISFNRTRFFEPSNTLMCNFTVWVEDKNAMDPNKEIDSYAWFTPEEAVENVKKNSLAGAFLKAYLGVEDFSY